MGAEAGTPDLDFGLEHNEGVAGVGEPEDAPKAVRCQVANLKDLELGRLGARSSAVRRGGTVEMTHEGAHVQLFDFDPVRDDGRLGALVERLDRVLDISC